jgi:hypothetical protein
MQTYSLLIGAEGRQTGAIVSLATKLRLSQSTRLRADAAAVLAAKPSLDSPKPWERGA